VATVFIRRSLPLFPAPTNFLTDGSDSEYAIGCISAYPQPMLSEIYIEAVDEELADLIWDAWDAGEISYETACIAWMLIAILC